jgi:hypothetical protein
MNILSRRNLMAFVAGAACIGSFAVTNTALAAGLGGFGHGMRPAVAGIVASAPDANGTFTVTSKSWQRGSTTSTPTTSTTYTVNTTSATIVTKTGASSSVSAIAVGDTVMIQGTVSGTNVAATKIYDGLMGRLGQMFGQKPKMEIASHTPAIAGNGQPIIGGNVTAISGSSLTVTNKSNVTYTVNMSSATISKMGVTGATLSNIVVGDSVIVQGTVNGTSVTASSIIDQGTPPSSSTSTDHPARGGFFGAIGGFFSHLFGFF